MAKAQTLPPRSKVKPSDTWDLTKLFPTADAWEKAFAAWEKQVEGFDRFKGKLSESAGTLAECLAFDAAVDRAGERLGVYAYLRTTEDQADSDAQRRKGRYQH